MIKKLISGIYKIEDIETGNVYVGSADSENGIKKRWSCHLAHLRKNKHYYKELQEAYNDNPERIKWEILDVCSDDELEERENYWIKYCDMIDGWHVINKEKRSKKRSKVKDTSNMSKAQTGDKNGHNTKLSVQDVKEIKRALKKGVKQVILAEQYNVSQTHIWNIANGVRWNSVQV
ncbi:GIY-YIG nuclease family protein [Clostridium botulinum]|uniref:GIY-YIG nuclease family protein n=2 Tax=Clostridium botulinum TaxID=1491 RepID=UPI001F3FDCE7|nr:GIY-YIG nuclease family protein [Clostridium botulinum]